MTPDARTVFDYHRETKHHFDRYARSPDYMDWRNQPEPFRIFEGCETVDLPFLDRDPEADYEALYRRANRRTDRSARSAPATLETVGALFELALGLSAWKSAGSSRWALRMNPSSGNLHPTEGYAILPELPGLSAGVFHYSPLLHALERRADIPAETAEALRAALGGSGFLIGLTGIFWREAWKYGERAWRYCNHDVGHALAALSFSAGLRGWRLVALNALGDGDVSAALGLDRTPWHPEEAEHPDLLCAVLPVGAEASATLPESLLAELAALEFRGVPRPLSARRVRWDRIHAVAAAAEKPRTAEPSPAEFARIVPARPFREGPRPRLSAAEIIRRRRSAVAFGGRGELDRAGFFAMLDRTLPRPDAAPFDLNLGPPAVDLLVFVHRVAGLEPGLYAFARAGDPEPLRAASDPDLSWSPTEADFPLFRLRTGDFRRRAMTASCHQEIAGHGVFSLGMIARFRETVAGTPWAYRRLFRETGMIGQVLYLEAEARGLRGTGIGCFFDDPVHEMLGLRDDSFQSLYHFTVGDPVEDSRLATPAPYHHLARKRS